MQNNRVAAVVGVLVIVLTVGLVVLVSRGGYHGKAQHTASRTATASPTVQVSPTAGATTPDQAVPSDLPTLPSGSIKTTYTFRIGTLNWRGASHYHRNPHHGERPYYVRAPHMIAKVNASGASVVGFQEFETPQANFFLRHTHGAWRIVPGRKRGGSRSDTRDAIAYRPADWKLLGVRYLNIVYAHHGHMEIPLAHLGSTHGNWRIWVLNTHNPASVRAIGGTPASRAGDVRIEARLLRGLTRSDPNSRLFFTGDMNSKDGFRNQFLAEVGKGWSTADPNTHRLIDWIMGSPGVTFSKTVVDWSTHDNAHSYTDHPFVHTTATITSGPAGR